ncbi:hypothetical protein KBC03_06465 [Patescibacteria group bacterium]|nr:hypothetical protein [Patescibacteria group bacterium]
MDIAEFISDVAAINTDVTYFSTPLSQYLTDEQSGKKAFEHYKLSKTMAATMITEIYIKYPNLADKL